jgi:riboflavin synthase
LGGGGFAADVSAETLSRTTLSTAAAGVRVNLEKALRLGDRLGGHIVLGHVDGVGKIREKTVRSQSVIFGCEIDPELARYVIPKGSITLDGISLTVNSCERNRFYVNIIPHTAAGTTLGLKKVSDGVNIETDVLSRYVEKLLLGGKQAGGVDLDMLSRYGFLK